MVKTDIKLNTDKRCTAFEGWGTSLCWFANVIGGWSDKNRNEIADLLFSKDRGLGLNVVRYNIWGGDHPDHRHMRAGGAGAGFMPSEDTWDWEADENQRWMLLAARDRGADQFEAFSNSPPYWMTVSQCSAGSADAGSNLKEEYYETFAEYLTEVVQHYRDRYGLVFQTLDPLNEPNTLFWHQYNRQEGCHFDPKDQMKLIKQVRRRLEQKGLTGTQISASDEYSIDIALDTFRSFDGEARECIYRINTHSYEGSMRRELREIASQYGKRLWMSEYGNGGNTGHDHCSILPALDLAAQIIKDLNGLNPTAWVYWQAVEDEAGTVMEDGNWGLIHGDFTGGTEEYCLTKKYYAMGNFSCFVRPGYHLLDTGLEAAAAFCSGDGRRLILILCNKEEGDILYTVSPACKETTYELAGLYRTSSSENLKKLPVDYAAGPSVEVTAAPKSVTTCVLERV